MTTPNLFETLFQYRPRDGLTPRENYLTEALAYVLKTDEGALQAFLSSIIGIKNVNLPTVEIKTQEFELGAETSERSYYDLSVSGKDTGGRAFKVLCEHKWGSGIGENQLGKYQHNLERTDVRTKLVLITDNPSQAGEARDAGAKTRLWADVCTCLESVGGAGPATGDLIGFLRSQGLGPLEKLSIYRMVSLVECWNLPDELVQYCRKLEQRDWSIIPDSLRGEIHALHNWGRVALQMNKNWREIPNLALGFLYEGRGHIVELTDKARGLDLIMRLEINPDIYPDPKIPKTLTTLAQKVSELAHRYEDQKFFAIQSRLEADNKWTALLIQQCLADVIRGMDSMEAQLDAIYVRLNQWLEILFQDGQLLGAMEFERAGMKPASSGGARTVTDEQL